jgi:two-component system, response regulator
VNEPYVLLVEDREEDIELTLRAFKRARLLNEIVVKRDGVDALEFLRTAEPPALMLIDINMPRMNGIELLQNVRELERLRFVPAIMLTSSPEERDLIAAYDRGANSYVRKPVASADFADLIGRLGMYWIVMNQLPAGKPPP